jgi:xylulokinase
MAGGGRQPALIGIDLGTSAIKVCAFDARGNLLCLERGTTPTQRLANGWAQHDPEELWLATARLLGRVCEAVASQNAIEAVAVASVGEAGVAVDGAGNAVYPAIAWFDGRSHDEAAFWEEATGASAINRITGQPLDPHYGVNKLLWLRRHEPAAFAAARQWLSLADFIVLRLCGVYATDQSLASRTMLFDQKRRDWSSDLLSVAGLSRDLLPPALAGGTRVGGISAGASAACGLRQGTPVVLAGHDRLCGAFAASGGSNIPIDSTGSAEAVILPVDRYVERSTEEARFVSCYADIVPGRYIYSARVGYAGALIDWLRRDFFSGSEGELSSEALESAIPRPLAYSGLLIYPSFGRIIAPFRDPESRRGAILGLTIDHHRGHVYQAFLEGICLSLRANLDWLEQLSGRPIARIRVEGGPTRSSVWLGLKADVTGRTGESVDIEEPTALGAALLAGVGVGLFADHQAAGAALSLTIATVQPDPARAVVYERVYHEAYLKLPAALAGFNRVLEAVAGP